MPTVKFIEEVLDIKLLDFQKDYLDYLDRHPDARVVLPRGRTVTCTYDLWLMAQCLIRISERITFIDDIEEYERNEYEKLKLKYGE